MASGSVRLFVYGSLKRGGRHHEELEAAGARFLGTAATLPGYRLEALDDTDYLALVPAGPGREEVVRGELFEVPRSQLPALDAFEGDAYVQGVVKVRLEPDRRASRSTPNAVKIESAFFEDSLAYFRKAR